MVTIYGEKPNYPFYRIAYRVAGKRHRRNFSKYIEALQQAKIKARDMVAGSQAAALTAIRSRDASVALPSRLSSRELPVFQPLPDRFAKLRWRLPRK
jgi:hypothetical protein